MSSGAAPSRHGLWFEFVFCFRELCQLSFRETTSRCGLAVEMDTGIRGDGYQGDFELTPNREAEDRAWHALLSPHILIHSKAREHDNRQQSKHHASD